MASTVVVEWTRRPDAIENPVASVPALLTDASTDRHAERTALTSVLYELAACKSVTPQEADESDIAYYQRLLRTYEERYATQRTRYERHTRAKLADVLMRAAIGADESRLGELVVLFSQDASALLQQRASSPAAPSSLQAKWAAFQSRLAEWSPQAGDVELAGGWVSLNAEEKLRLDGIIESMHTDLGSLVGQRTATLAALDAALAEQVLKGNDVRANNAASSEALLASLAAIFAQMRLAWTPPSQESFAQPVSFVNERVAEFDGAMRRWKNDNALAQRKLEVLQALTTSLNDAVDLPTIYGGSGGAGKPFSAQMIKNAPQHLASVFALWAAENYDTPRARATRDVGSYRAAIESAMTTMVGGDRVTRELNAPLTGITALANLDDVTTLTANVDAVRTSVARASAEYARQLETLKRLLSTLNEVVKDAVRAIDSSAAVPSLDRLSNPAQYVEAIIQGKSAERVQRANDLQQLVGAVELAINAIDASIWTETIAMPAGAAAAPLTLRVAFDDVKQRTLAFATNTNRDVATFFASPGGSQDYIDRLQRVMAELLARVQQRAATIAQRAQQLADNQDALFNLTRSGADAIYSGSEAARLPSQKDMVGVRGAIDARTKQRLRARYDVYSELHYLIESFDAVYAALREPLRARPAAPAAYTHTEEEQAAVEVRLGPLQRAFAAVGVASPGDTSEQARFGQVNAVYESRLNDLASLVSLSQPVLYAFIQRTQRVGDQWDSTLERLYALMRDAASALSTREQAGSAMPAKGQASAIYEHMLGRIGARSTVRVERFDVMAAYARALTIALTALGVLDTSNEAMVNALLQRFYTAADGHYSIDTAKRQAFGTNSDNASYEGAVSAFVGATEALTPTVYEAMRQRQEAERQTGVLDTAHSLLKQAFDAIYDERDATPYPSKADVPKTMQSVLDSRLQQRREALGTLFDRIGQYLRATRTALVALNASLVERYRSLTRHPSTRELVIPAEMQDVRQELLFLDRLEPLLAFFDPAVAATRASNRQAFATSSQVLAAQLLAASSFVSDGSMQAVFATLAQRERAYQIEKTQVDTIYALLQTVADAIYSGREAERLVPRERAAELVGQIEQRRVLRDVERGKEYDRITQLLLALKRALQVLGDTYGIGIDLPALSTALTQFVGDGSDAATRTLREQFTVSRTRAEAIGALQQAVLAVQTQSHVIAKAAEMETQALTDAVQTAYSSLSNMAAQLGSSPPLPSLKDVRATPMSLIAAIQDRITQFQGGVGETRASLRAALGALYQILTAVDMSAYTMSRTELFQAAPALNRADNALTQQFLSDNMDDAVPLPAVLDFLFKVAGDDSFTSFTGLRFAVEAFSRALSLHAAERLQTLSRNRERGETLVKQIESLTDSVIQQITTTFGRDVALAKLRGVEAASQVRTIMDHSVYNQFKALADRILVARNLLLDVEDVLNATTTARPPIPWISDLYASKDDAVASALAQIEHVKEEAVARGTTLATRFADAKANLARAESVVKEIERAARGYDATKVSIDLQTAQRTLTVAVQNANTAVAATGLAVDISSISGVDASQENIVAMDQLKINIDAAIRAQRAANADLKTLTDLATEQAKSIAQVARGYDSTKALQEQVKAYSDLLGAYRSAADTMILAAISNKRGRASLPFSAYRLVATQLSANQAVAKQVFEAMQILAQPPRLDSTIQESPFAGGVPSALFSVATANTGAYLLEVIAQAEFTLTQGAIDVMGAAELYRHLLMDRWSDAYTLFVPRNELGAYPRRTNMMTSLRNAVVDAGNIQLPAIYNVPLPLRAAIDAWVASGVGADATVEPWVKALAVFALRYLTLAMLYLPAAVADASNDTFQVLASSESSLAVCVARQIELFVRGYIPVPPVAVAPAVRAANEIRTSLQGVAKKMYHPEALANGQALDTAALSTPDIVNSIFRPRPYAGLGGLGGGGGGGGDGDGGGADGGRRRPRPVGAATAAAVITPLSHAPGSAYSDNAF